MKPVDKNIGFEKVSWEQWVKDYPFTNDDLEQDVSLPIRKTKWSAGYDIFATYSFSLEPDESIKMPLGWKVYMPPSVMMLVLPRSGMAFKYYVRLANTVGLIDADYYNNTDNEGHCWLKIRNEGDKKLVIKQGNAVAQAVFTNYLLVDGDSFDMGRDRVGGLGSTTIIE